MNIKHTSHLIWNGLINGKWNLIQQATGLLFLQKNKYSISSPLLVNGIEVTNVNEQKHLWLMLDEKLSFDQHINEKNKNCSKDCCFMKRLLSLIRSNAKIVFGIDDPTGLIHLFLLRVKLSPLTLLRVGGGHCAPPIRPFVIFFVWPKCDGNLWLFTKFNWESISIMVKRDIVLPWEPFSQQVVQ